MIKRTLNLIGILFVFGFLVQSQAQERKVKIQVDGLACPFCAYGLEKKLKEIDGVKKLDIQVDSARVVMIFEQDALVDSMKIVRKVKEAGFTARKIIIGNNQPRHESKAIKSDENEQND